MHSQNRKGAVIVLVAILLPVLIILAAFVINLAQVELNRTEMYIAADAAARAGGRTLTLTQDPTAATDAAKQFAELNNVFGNPMTLDDDDVVVGTSQRPGSGGRYEFVPGGNFPNAVEVTTRRESGAPDGPIQLILPNIIGSGPFSTRQTAISSQVDLDVALIIDRSGSMAYGANETAAFPPAPASAPPGWDFCDEAPPVSRWRDVLAAINIFTNELSTTATREFVGLGTYNETANIDQPLTDNYDLIGSALNVYTDSFCEGGTNIGGGIEAGVDILSGSSSSRTGAVKVIIVLTDGIHNIGRNPNRAANNAADDGALIFTVTFSNEADQARMQQVANTGAGKHFHATNADDLIEVFRAISKELPNLLTH